MSFLEALKKEPAKQAPGMLLYSDEGVGKTTLACKIPKSCIVIHPDEDGVGDLKQAGQVPPDYPVFEVNSWRDVLGLIDELTATTPFKAVAFDTANTLLQRLCFEHVSKEHFKGEWSDFQNWDKGVKRALPEWDILLDKLTKLRRAGVMVLLLAHCRKTDFKNPQGGNYMRFQPDLYDSFRADGPSFLLPTKRWASDIGFMDYEITEERGKAKGGRQRRLRFQHDAAFDAKNRCGIDSTIDLGFTADEAFRAFVNAFQPKKKDN